MCFRTAPPHPRTQPSPGVLMQCVAWSRVRKAAAAFREPPGSISPAYGALCSRPWPSRPVAGAGPSARILLRPGCAEGARRGWPSSGAVAPWFLARGATPRSHVPVPHARALLRMAPPRSVPGTGCHPGCRGPGAYAGRGLQRGGLLREDAAQTARGRHSWKRAGRREILPGGDGHGARGAEGLLRVGKPCARQSLPGGGGPGGLRNAGDNPGSAHTAGRGGARSFRA